MYDLTDLKLIRYMSEESSLSAVAVRARMSLPAISQRLTKLEDGLATKLVIRSGGFGLTAAGKIFLESANAIAAELKKLDRQLRAEKQGHEAMLRIMCTQSLLVDDLPLILDTLSTEDSSLRFTVTEGAASEIARKLADGEIDIGLAVHTGSMQGLQLIPYKAERACIIAPLKHQLAQQRGPIYFRDAIKFPFIGIDDNNPVPNLAGKEARADLRSIAYRILVSSMEAQAILVGQTQLGIALTLESVARRHARTQPIQVIRLADTWASHESFICVRDPFELSIAGQHFVALIKSRFGSS